MKKTIAIAVILFSALFLAACQQDGPEYFIRYEGHYSDWSPGPDRILTYTFTTPDGEVSMLGGASFEYFCGPVEKGFKAEMTIEGGDWNRCRTEIYVARGKNGAYLRAAKGGAYVSYSVE